MKVQYMFLSKFLFNSTFLFSALETQNERPLDTYLWFPQNNYTDDLFFFPFLLATFEDCKIIMGNLH